MMKHLTLVFSVMALAALSSCKKERDCKCEFTMTNTSNGSSVSTTSTTTSGKLSRRDAKTWCESYESDYTLNGYSYENSCELD